MTPDHGPTAPSLGEDEDKQQKSNRKDNGLPPLRGSPSQIRRREYVNHYSFHIIDPEWGHVTIKMSGHPPFGAQIILNGHEFVARQAGAAGIAFTKAGNCFTAVADPAGLARIADALSQDAAVGRLGQVCQRWIYTACLCFGLDRDEQHRSGFGYGFAVYQLEYSRNLIFADGTTMQRVFDTVVDRTRSRLDVPKVRTIFGSAQRPRRTRKRSSLIEAAIETPSYDLTVFKLHFGRLTGKAYTKDEMCWGDPLGADARCYGVSDVSGTRGGPDDDGRRLGRAPAADHLRLRG